MEKNESIKLKALSDIASIDITLEFSKILQHILQITCKTMNAHSGTIMLVDEAAGELRMVSSHGLPEDYIERVYAAADKAGVTLTSSPSGTVLKSGNYYIVPNIFQEPKDEPWYELSKNLGFSAQIFTPIKRGLKVIGLLNIYMKDVYDFTDEDIYFMNITASQASSVVQNATICSKLKNNIRELKDHKQHLEEKIKEAHKVLFESERYLKKIIESSMDGIFVVDEQGKFEFGNDSAFNIFGWKREELIGHFFMKIIPENLTDFMLERWHEIQNGIEKPYETRIFTKEGEIRNLLVSQSQTTIKGKRKYVVVIKDISEKQRLETELKESEAGYRDLFENAKDPIYTIDIKGYFQTINQAGCIVLNAAKEDIIGTHISKWLTPHSLESAKQRINNHASKACLEEPVEYELVCNGGLHRFAEIRTRPIIKDGSIIGIHGMGRDITEKKRLEEKVREYQDKLKCSYEELIEVDRAKTEFVSNITHELLTPLTSIKGFAELLSEGTIGTINPEQKKSLDIILRNSDRLIKLIRELLDSTRLENNTFLMQFNNVSLESIISKTIQDIHPQANEKQITIIRDIQPLTQIWGDDERLMQVIRNILINAIKFTPRMGKITIKSSSENEHVMISISDTGIGIPKDKLSTIFERFYQVDGSVSRKYGGVGLGLSICKKIIEKHNGSIWAESEGNGSTFHIMLPKYRSKYVS